MCWDLFLQYHMDRDFCHYFIKVFLEESMHVFKGYNKIKGFFLNSTRFRTLHVPWL